ncbi:MAG: acyltransferase [Methylococcales bacterium]|nr:acyltransferase [Methylococcales bacterium]
MISAHRVSVFEGRANHFNLIRMSAAMVVVFSHAHELLGVSYAAAEAVKRMTGIAASGYGLAAFFFISGFLIARSLLHRADSVFFVKSRLARLYPGLLLSLLYSALIIGPCFTHLELSAYFIHPQTWHFVADNLVIILPYKEQGLPGVFAGHVNTLVNGSLWTLAWESLFYAGLWLVWRLGGLACRWLIPALALALLVVYLHVLTSKTLTDVILLSGLGFSVLFVLGASVYVLGRGLILHPLGLSMSVVTLAGLMLMRGSVADTLKYLMFCYVLLQLAYWPARRLLVYNKWGDFSYGLYLGHFPVMQILLELKLASSPWSLFGLTLLCALPLAVLSWFWVERPVLRWVRNRHRHVAVA